MSDEYIKIMPDYQCFPLWLIGKGTVENISQNELPIPDRHKIRVTNWQIKYNSTLNQEIQLNQGLKT